MTTTNVKQLKFGGVISLPREDSSLGLPQKLPAAANDEVTASPVARDVITHHKIRPPNRLWRQTPNTTTSSAAPDMSHANPTQVVRSRLQPGVDKNGKTVFSFKDVEQLLESMDFKKLANDHQMEGDYVFRFLNSSTGVRSLSLQAGGLDTEPAQNYSQLHLRVVRDAGKIQILISKISGQYKKQLAYHIGRNCSLSIAETRKQFPTVWELCARETFAQIFCKSLGSERSANGWKSVSRSSLIAGVRDGSWIETLMLEPIFSAVCEEHFFDLTLQARVRSKTVDQISVSSGHHEVGSAHAALRLRLRRNPSGELVLIPKGFDCGVFCIFRSAELEEAVAENSVFQFVDPTDSNKSYWQHLTRMALNKLILEDYLRIPRVTGGWKQGNSKEAVLKLLRALSWNEKLKQHPVFTAMSVGEPIKYVFTCCCVGDYFDSPSFELAPANRQWIAINSNFAQIIFYIERDPSGEFKVTLHAGKGTNHHEVAAGFDPIMAKQWRKRLISEAAYRRGAGRTEFAFDFCEGNTAMAQRLAHLYLNNSEYKWLGWPEL